MRSQRGMPVLAGTVVLAFTLGGCLVTSASARSLNAILSSGEIRVGVNPQYPPTSEYDSKNQLVGFDVDLSNQIGTMLGVKVKYVIVTAASRIPFLTSGKIDYVMGAMTRTPERAKLIDFTIPVNTESMGILTLANKPYSAPSDMNKKGITLVEVRGTTGAALAAKDFPKATLLLLDSHPDALRAIAQGRADGTVEDTAYLGQAMKTVSADWKLLKQPVGEVSYDCLGVAQADVTLRRWLNVAVFQLLEDGFIYKDWRKYYGANMLVPTPINPVF